MSANPRDRQNAWAVFMIFLRLGLTSFGGPVAHLGFFRQEFVIRRQWLSERSYADLVALCQSLPGPASSQLGMALGLYRCGCGGALAAWAGFTLPSAIAMILLAGGFSSHADRIPTGVLEGLKIAAVAVVAQAVWGMARALCPDATRISLMVAVCWFLLLVPSVWAQMVSIVAAALVGLLLFKPVKRDTHERLPMPIRPRTGLIFLALFVVILAVLPAVAFAFPSSAAVLVNAFYRAGSLVFGGGHVVLPLLQTEIVSSGWVSIDAFLAGYGAAQAVPGPLFSFAAFLGASMNQAPNGWLGGVICLVAIFTPSFLLVLGVLPFWERLRHNTRMQAALLGINASVVGLLLAALYQPVWTSAIKGPGDFGIALTAFVALIFWQLPPWMVVLGSGGAGLLASVICQ